MYMKKFFMLIILVLLPAISYAQPAIVFDTENYNFGNVINKDIIEYAFDFTNAGDKELTINKLVPS
jgi:hypothetical protein